MVRNMIRDMVTADRDCVLAMMRVFPQSLVNHVIRAIKVYKKNGFEVLPYMEMKKEI